MIVEIKNFGGSSFIIVKIHFEYIEVSMQH